uniref:Tubulin-specific chaperone C n=1 Tax=Neogobius melanostomus TaxID=47308 RepID=A0A8C6UD24_9GOBI
MAAAVEDYDALHPENNASKVPEWLTKRHQSRLEDAEKRREAKDSLKPEQEQTDFFKSEFDRERAAVEALLSACAGADRAAAEERLERATAQTARLQKFLNDSVLFLPQYELRKAQAALQSLQAALNEARDEALPKKKFAFRARSKATEKTPTNTQDSPPPQSDVPDGGSSKAALKPESEPCVFSDLSDETLTIAASEIERRDVLLSRLRNCRVRLQGSPGTLHLKDLEACEVLCGPVCSSVFVDRCTDSVLALACQQLRTHNTRDTAVYLHVTCRAIIEDCSGVSFAPFAWTYPGLDRDYETSGLDRSRNHWSDVDDFNWLAAGTPSPNWSVIPEGERRADWA